MDVAIESGSQNTITYLRGNGLEGYLKNGTSRKYYYKEPNGSTYIIYGDENNNYEPVGEYAYGGFGNLIWDNWQETSFAYAGEYHDDETGFIYLRNRYYDPETGRFISEDPAMDGLNWYAYCNNNPVNFVDPWGLNAWTNTRNEMETLISLLHASTGYNGYGYEEKDGMYLLIDTGGNVDGGSEVARGMVSFLFDEHNDIYFDFNSKTGGITYLYSDGTPISSTNLEQDVEYINRYAVVSLKETEGSRAIIELYHEMDHAISFIYDHYNKIIISEQYRNTPGSKSVNSIISKYMEASAITISNKISEELNLGIKDSYTRNGYYLNGEWVSLSQPIIYGSFPYEYTGGSATILRSYGSNKHVYYSMRGVSK